MNTRQFLCARLGATAIAALAVLAATADAVLPMSGWPVPELVQFDNLMWTYMSQRNLKAGVLAVSRNGVIVYQRGFGFLTSPPNAIFLPENTPMRLASCTKPITSAAIRKLVAANQINWTDPIFDLGQMSGGILHYTPWLGIGDRRLKAILLQHVFNHQGGWDITRIPNPWSFPPYQPGMEPVFESINIANTMGVAYPADRDNTIRFMLSLPLQYNPGTNGCVDENGDPTFCYSNFGYMLLGEVVESVSGMSTIDYVRQNVLTPALWVPSTEIFPGRSFKADQDPREPGYVSSLTCPNVFDGGATEVNCPYGGWEHEAFVGFGNLVASAAPLLTYMNWYQVGAGGVAGTPLAGQGWTAPGSVAIHNGTLQGTSTIMYQRGDNINIVVLLNTPTGNSFAMAQSISESIDAGGITWPTRAVDGAWVDFYGSNSLEVGAYDLPYRTMDKVAASVTDGTKLRFKPGTSLWSGTLTKKLLLDAPLGTARIGG